MITDGASPAQKTTRGDMISSRNPRLVLPQKRQEGSCFSRFHLTHVSQSAAIVLYGDVCQATCKSPTPSTCKLECHSGAPFTDMDEPVPASIFS